MVLAAIAISGVFSGLGLIPQGARPTRTDKFSTVALNHKFFLNMTAVLLLVALYWVAFRRGATDPVCGMRVARRKSLVKLVGARAFYFCSRHCLHQFEADPDRYLRRRRHGGSHHDEDGHAHGEPAARTRLRLVRS